MARSLRFGIPLLVLLAAVAAAPRAHALGPVDGEVGAFWWQNDFNSTGGSTGVDSSSAGAPGFRAELWFFKRYGLRAGRVSSDLDDLDMDSSSYTSIDLLWKAFAPTQNNFVAVGAGWEQLDAELIGLEGQTSGARLTAQGRFSVARIVYLYGEGSYLPSLDDTRATNPLDGSFENISGREFEAGVCVKPMPFVSFRAGYRANKTSFTRTDFDAFGTEIDGEVEAKGFLAGVNLNF
ncbi:MAG TPA: hypothetical protein VJS92_14410 [Candidatus Polarisedimenticolaceae bacterium]|nr:hypothetical protein [Candidatus Polarisedimenticolaceae bacterium]